MMLRVSRLDRIAFIPVLLVFFFFRAVSGESLPPAIAHLSSEQKIELMVQVLEQAINSSSPIYQDNLLEILKPDSRKRIGDWLTARDKKNPSKIAGSSGSGLDNIRLVRGKTNVTEKGFEISLDVELTTTIGTLKRATTLLIDTASGHPMFVFLDSLLSKARSLNTLAEESGISVLRTPSRTASVATIPPTMNILTPIDLDSNAPRMSFSTSNSLFGNPIFNRPYGILPVLLDLDVNSLDRNYLFITDCNWDRIIGTSSGATQWIADYGSSGSGAGQFRNPTGIDWASGSKFVVADAFNDRVTSFSLNDVATSGNEIVQLDILSDGFNIPIDVASAIFQDIQGAWSTKVAVLDQGNHRVRTYDINGIGGFTFENSFCTQGSGDFQLSYPTAITYARNPATQKHTPYLYIADNGNKRIVMFNSQITSIQFYTTDPGVFPSNAYLTSVEVDQFGYVYVVDGANGQIYLFSSGLGQPIAVYGSMGEGNNQFLYPTTLKVLRGWQNDTIPIVGGDVFVTEHFGNNSGVRRYRLRVDATLDSINYEPRYGGGSTHKLNVRWFQVGQATANVTMTFPGSSHFPNSISSTTTKMPGSHLSQFEIVDQDPDGWYKFDVLLTSIYDPLNTVSFSDSLNVSKSVDTSNAGCGIRVNERYHIMEDGTHFSDFQLTGRPCTYKSVTKWYGAGVDAVDVFNGNPLQYTWKSAYGVDFYLDTVGSAGFADSIVTFQDSIYYKFVLFPSGTSNGSHLNLLNLTIIPLAGDGGGGGGGSVSPGGGTGQDDLDQKLGSQRAVLDISWGCGISQFFNLSYTTECNTPCTTCVQAGCPVLYSWDGSNYGFVNNILPQSESDTLVFDDKLDFYPIENYVLVDSFYYRFRIAEEEQEVSYLDRLEIFALDVPYSKRNIVFDQTGGLIQLVGEPVLPIAATTQSGRDILPMLLARDQEIFEPGFPGYVDISYKFVAGTKGGPTASVSAAAGGGEIPDPGKDPSTKVTASVNPRRVRQSIIMARNALGEYEEITKSPARDKKVGMYSQWSDYIINGQLDLRIKWSNSIRLDYMPFRWFERPLVKPKKLELRSAVHSTQGEKKLNLDRTRDQPVTLSPGEQIDLTYYAKPPPEGIRRLLFLKAKGKYESLLAPRSASGGGNLPRTYSFDQNYPNPFNPSTSFSFALPKATHVTLKVYNILGQTVATLIDNDYEAGEHSFNWDGKLAQGGHIATGVYFAKLTAGDFSSSRKMMVLK